MISESSQHSAMAALLLVLLKRSRTRRRRRPRRKLVLHVSELLLLVVLVHQTNELRDVANVGLTVTVDDIVGSGPLPGGNGIGFLAVVIRPVQARTLM